MDLHTMRNPEANSVGESVNSVMNLIRRHFLTKPCTGIGPDIVSGPNRNPQGIRHLVHIQSYEETQFNESGSCGVDFVQAIKQVVHRK